MIAWASSYYLPAVMAGPLSHSVGIAPAEVFLGLSGALLLSALLAPVVGRAIEHLDGRRVLAASNGVFASGLLILSTAKTSWGMVGAWGLLGVAMAMGLYDAAFSVLTRLYGAAAKEPITVVALVAGFASTVGWPVTAWMDQVLGWRLACVAWAALHLCVALPLNLSLPKATTPTTPVSTVATAPSAGTLVPTRDVLTLLAYVFAANWFVSTALAAHLPTLFVGTGMTLSAAVAAASLVGPAQVAARMAEMMVLRRAGSLTSAMAACLLHPLGVALFLFAGAPAAAFAILHGAGNGILTIATGTVPLALFGADGYSRRQGWLALPARAAQALAPFAFATLMSVVGSEALLGTAGLLVAGAAALGVIAHRE
ncbi:MFS transporter [Dyella sp. AtDHG13]|uniref:MFS transporter n=1 Tax=Dyella sp. AtDHG13 TaxID=1938897 RepID=UPI0018F33D6B|nr:MFS transporter [Dyella sp. AtDHG13]